MYLECVIVLQVCRVQACVRDHLRDASRVCQSIVYLEYVDVLKVCKV